MIRILCLICIFSLQAKAQYDLARIRSILTEDATAAWTVQGVNTVPDVKSYVFNINGNVVVQPAKTGASASTLKWKLTSNDNIRWFIDIGKEKFELIISFDKKGQRYIKFIRRPDKTRSVYYEIMLYPAKK